jgi:adenosylcobinamide-phosphate synthase
MAMTPGMLLGACLVDAAMGDPRWLPHPVRLMGRAISTFESVSKQWACAPSAQRIAGVVMAVGLPSIAYGAGWWIIRAAGSFHAGFGIVTELLLAASTLAARDLSEHITAVERALQSSLDAARAAVSRIVGRDTDRLCEEEIVRATVEATAESVSDGILAPLFYLMLGGAPLALAYKAISTLDSMVGHRTTEHLYFGWASARLDDFANWVPARLTAGLLVVAGGIQTRSLGTVTSAIRILRRDGHRHPSPNAGHPEAAMAGVLQVRLGGMNFYGGIPEARPFLGDPMRALSRLDLIRARQLMWIVYTIGMIVAVGVLAL